MLETGNVMHAAEVGTILPTPFESARGYLGPRMLTRAWAFAASRTEIVETVILRIVAHAFAFIHALGLVTSGTRDHGGPHPQFHPALLLAIEEWLSEHGCDRSI